MNSLEPMTDPPGKALHPVDCRFEGVIYSCTSLGPEALENTPHPFVALALVRLDQGRLITTRVRGSRPEEMRIGARVSMIRNQRSDDTAPEGTSRPEFEITAEPSPGELLATPVGEERVAI